MNVIQKLVEKDELKQALQKLLDYIPSTENSDRSTVILLQGQLAAWEKRKMLGIDTSANLDIQRNKLRYSIIELSDKPYIPTADNSTQKEAKTQTKSTINGKAKIYFSYAWGDQKEKGESREKIVDELYQSLEKDDFNVIRDKMDLDYGGLISEFMEDIGEGDLIVVFVSKKYMKSPYCMFELYEIARNSKWDKNIFAQRILPIRVEVVAFGDPDVLDEHFDYWEKEEKKWAAFIQKRIGQISEGQTQKYHNIKDIHQNFGKLSDFLVDINSSNKKLLSQDDFAQIKDAIVSRLG